MRFGFFTHLPKAVRSLVKLDGSGVQVMGSDIRVDDLPFDFAVSLYHRIAIQLFEVVSDVFDGYHPDQFRFVPSTDRLECLFRELQFTARKFGRRKDFNQVYIGNLDQFRSLNGDFQENIRFWLLLKDTIHQEIKELQQKYYQPYQLTNDLQICFLEMKQLLGEHQLKKHQVLSIDTDLTLSCGDLTLNLSTATLTYQTQVIPIQLARQEMKFLIELLKHSGKVVSYQDLANVVDFGANIPEADISVLVDRLKVTKHNLKKYLIKQKLLPKSAQTIVDGIKSITRTGYRIDL